MKNETKNKPVLDEDGDVVEEIKVCSRCSEIPMIWTFAFNGSEWWCPKCGKNEGMMGAGENIPITQELFNLGEALSKELKSTDGYLHAKGIQVCVATIWKGEKIDPADLPDKEKERLEKIVNEWEYNKSLKLKNGKLIIY